MRMPSWATIFTLFALIILCGLGSWQLKRLAYKTKLINQIQSEFVRDPMFTELAPGVLLQSKMHGVFFIRGFIEGIYLHDKEILVGPRTMDGEKGYHVVTPFESFMSDDAILVNRGWIPHDLPRDQISRPANSMIITGTATKPAQPNGFTPANSPATDEWFWIDTVAIAEDKKLKSLMPYILYADPQRGGKWPVALPVPFKTSHNHLQYALTWFSLALVLLGVYYFRFIRKK
jgi:surfeit locus 1 family protein